MFLLTNAQFSVHAKTTVLKKSAVPLHKPAVAKAAPPVKVPYGIRKLLPRGAKSRAFASLPLKSMNQPVLAHFYDVKPMAHIGQTGWYYDEQKCALELFVNAEKNRFKRINALPIRYQRWKDRSDIASLETRWLNSKEKTKPIIIVQLADFGPLFKNRTNGSDILVVFPDGLSGKAVTQQFAFGSFSGGTTDSITSAYSTDEKGFFTVTQTISSSSGTKTTLWKWNGKALAVAESKIRSWEDITNEINEALIKEMNDAQRAKSSEPPKLAPNSSATQP